MSLEKVYDYFHNYDRQTYQVVACMGNEPSEEDIKKFENQYQVNLPADFREFTMSSLGGLYMEVREEIWPQAKPYDIGPLWEMVMKYSVLIRIIKLSSLTTIQQEELRPLEELLQTVYWDRLRSWKSEKTGKSAERINRESSGGVSGYGKIYCLFTWR